MPVSVDDFKKRYPEDDFIKLIDGDVSVSITQAIADAKAKIASILDNTEIADTDKAFVDFANCEIARYYLYSEQATDIVKERYEYAVNDIRRLAGLGSTDGSDSGSQDDVVVSGISVKAPKPVFAK